MPQEDPIELVLDVAASTTRSLASIVEDKDEDVFARIRAASELLAHYRAIHC